MEFLTTALSGVGISVVGLCLLRTWRSRSWASVSRVAHLADKTLSGQVMILFQKHFNKEQDSKAGLPLDRVQRMQLHPSIFRSGKLHPSILSKPK